MNLVGVKHRSEIKIGQDNLQSYSIIKIILFFQLFLIFERISVKIVMKQRFLRANGGFFIKKYRQITNHKEIYLQQSVRMPTEHCFRLARIHQRKCNFCFQWCEIPYPLEASLLCCDSCYEDFLLNGLQLQNTKGQFFNLVLEGASGQGDQLQAVKGQLESLMNYDVQETFMRWSRIQSLVEENDLTHADIETIQEQIEQFHRGYEEQKEHLAQFIKNFTHSKSRSALDSSTEANRPPQYQSLLQNRKDKHINPVNSCLLPRQASRPSSDKTNRLEDYCKNLGATRFVKRYQYYFDTSEIKRYKETTKPFKTREFGCQLSPNFNESSNVKSKDSNCKPREYHKIRSNRSLLSQCPEKSLKLSEQELRSRILSYLQPRSQSVTMTRLMATIVREAYLRTNLQSTMIELISFRVSSMDLQCYFSLFDLTTIQTIKLVNVGLTDQQLLTILDLVGNSVERLVLTGNCLTENALGAFLGRALPQLRQLYLGKNRISRYRVKENIAELRSRFILYL